MWKELLLVVSSCQNHDLKIRTQNHLRTEHSESDSDPQTCCLSSNGCFGASGVYGIRFFWIEGVDRTHIQLGGVGLFGQRIKVQGSVIRDQWFSII